MKHLITILLSILISQYASAQKNIIGSWIKVSPTRSLSPSAENPFSAAAFNGHIFSFKDNGRLEIKKLHEANNVKNFETSIQGSKIIISEDGVPFDTLSIIESSPGKLHLLQTQIQQHIYLIRENNKIEAEQIQMFLRENNFKIIPASKEGEVTDISHYIYKEDHFFMQNESYKSYCNLKYKAELQEYDFGNILNISLKDGEINYSMLVRKISDTHIYGDLITGNLQKIYIEKIDEEEPAIKLSNEDLIGSYYTEKKTLLHGDSPITYVINSIKFVFNADQTFVSNRKADDNMTEYSGNWEIRYHSSMCMLKLTLLSEEEPFSIFYQIQNLSQNSLTLYKPTCNGVSKGNEIKLKKLE